LKDERLTIFAGHFGSGKTNIAINYALRLKNECGKAKVALADLDIVNPYFRAGRSAPLLRENGIRVIMSDYANTNLDAPAMPGEAVSLFDDETWYGVIDIGGDDRGAAAAGRYKERINNEQSKNILLVVNCYRPLSREPREIVTIKNEIEKAAGFKFTGIINNSNIGNLTEAEDVINSMDTLNEVSIAASLPIVMTCAEKSLSAALDGTISDVFGICANLTNKLRFT